MKIGQIRERKTGFGWWMLSNMDERGWSCEDVAEKLQISRQTVYNHISGLYYPPFMQVIAYCWVFDSKDDPREIYNLLYEKEVI